MTDMNNKNKGFTLLETMIAVVVFSFGLLGIAGVMTVSVKNNHNGYMRSQAAFLASSMMDLMRENQIGLWTGLYDGIYNNFTPFTPVNDCSAGCNFTGLAARDVIHWSNMINQILPNSSGVVACVNAGLPVTGIPIMVTNPVNAALPDIACANCSIDPYNGFCTVTVNWTEADITSSSRAQSFVLVGKP